MNSGTLKDIVIAFSLSNLCFINAWRSLLTPSSSFYYYHQKNLPPPVEYFSLIFSVVVLAILLLIGIRLARHTSVRLKRWANRIFLLILSAPVYGLLSQLDNNVVVNFLARFATQDVNVKRLLVSTVMAITITLIVIGLWRLEAATRIAVGFLLVLSPLVLITFVQASYFAAKYRSVTVSAPLLESGNQRKGPRVLWLVFDEFDFRVAFAERDKTVKLPNIDRLVSESLSATNAHPPAGETLLSMPSLITGRVVTAATPEGPDQLMLKFGDDKPAVSWKSQPSIFSHARAAGINTALVGWYHPYCRVLGADLTQCNWEGQLTAAEMDQVVRGEQVGLANDWAGFLRGVRKHARTAVFTFPFVTSIFERRLDVQQIEREKDVLDFERTLSLTVAAANDRNLGLVFSHWPIPHSPNIYDRSTRQVSAAANHSYLDNLELVDDTMGKLRASMEAQGTWDESVILITSDHWWRSSWRKEPGWTAEDERALGNSSDTRIPFILKMPGKNSRGELYERSFNTVLSHDLVLAILEGTVTDTQGVTAWLDQHPPVGS